MEKYPLYFKKVINLLQNEEAMQTHLQSPQLETTPPTSKPLQFTSQPKPQPTFASAEKSYAEMLADKRGSDSPDIPEGTELVPPLLRTWCRINKTDLQGRKPPISDQPNTLWWDLSDIQIPQSVILKRLDEEPIVGWSFRSKQEWVELAYDTIQLRDIALFKEVSFPGYEQKVKPVKARRIGGSEICIQLVNVPLNRQVEQPIREAFATYGIVSDLAAVIYVDSTNKWSRRWNLILNVPEGSYLPMAPLITIYGCEVALFWQNAKPVCTICFTVGHYSQDCNTYFRGKASKRKHDKL